MINYTAKFFREHELSDWLKALDMGIKFTHITNDMKIFINESNPVLQKHYRDALPFMVDLRLLKKYYDSYLLVSKIGVSQVENYLFNMFLGRYTVIFCPEINDNIYYKELSEALEDYVIITSTYRPSSFPKRTNSKF